MAEDLSKKGLDVRSIKQVAQEETDYIEARKDGTIQSLKTPWDKYNDVSMGGIEWFTMHTIAGASGSGKTAILNQLETDLILLNPNEKFDILSFNFEMLARNLVGRKYSKALGMTVQELHSGKRDHHLTDEDFNRIKEQQKRVENLPIYYVDEAGTVDDVRRTIFEFAKRDHTRGLLITLDHTILVNGKMGEMERIVLINLVKMFKQAIKYFAKCGQNFSVVLLSQLNRYIEELERTGEPGSQNYPKKRDIFGGDSLYQMSDVVLVTMNPYQMGMDMYGPHRWETKGRLYWHFLKVREGEAIIAAMENKLATNEVKDLDLGSMNQGQVIDLNS